MKCLDYAKIEGTAVDDPKAKGATMRIAAGPDDGAPNFIMRVFTVAPGGHSPRHLHGFEHEIFFYQGSAEVYCDGETCRVGPGFAAYVPPNVEHQIINDGSADLVFVCVIPRNVG